MENSCKGSYLNLVIIILFAIFFFAFTSQRLVAQHPHVSVEKVKVINDSAEYAIHLLVDSGYYKSNTTNCTLEEECLNKALTSKCIVYHNDQWFTFTTTDSLVYYLSVKGQNCRDINGVQLLLIDGCICKPATYNLLKCVSLATQDDISLTLTGLQNNHQYIIIVDGYLYDFCEFNISISTRPPEFHLRTDKQIKISAQANKEKIEFEWELNEELKELEIVDFEILRREKSEKKFSTIKKIETERSVKGDYKTNYNYTDSLLNSGLYYYKVIAVSNKGERFLLSEHTFHVYINHNLIPLELDLKKKTVISINISNFFTKEILGVYKAEYKDDFKLDLKPYIRDNDVQKVKLIITNLNNTFKKELIVDIK